MLTATEPWLDDERPVGEDALEAYCTECVAVVGIFISRGNEWLHYTGRPETADVRPYTADHDPTIGWRIPASRVTVVHSNPN